VQITSREIPDNHTHYGDPVHGWVAFYGTITRHYHSDACNCLRARDYILIRNYYCRDVRARAVIIAVAAFVAIITVIAASAWRYMSEQGMPRLLLLV